MDKPFCEETTELMKAPTKSVVSIQSQVKKCSILNMLYVIITYIICKIFFGAQKL